MRLIDADTLLPMMKYATTDSEIGVFPIKIGFNTITKVIDDVPTVDAVQIKWLLEQAENPYNTDEIRNAIDYIVYTLWAERKEK